MCASRHVCGCYVWQIRATESAVCGNRYVFAEVLCVAGPGFRRCCMRQICVVCGAMFGRYVLVAGGDA